MENGHNHAYKLILPSDLWTEIRILAAVENKSVKDVFIGCVKKEIDKTLYSKHRSEQKYENHHPPG